MAAARKQMSGGDVKSGAGERPLSNPNYDEAVLRVQEWNEALKCSYFPLCMRWVVSFLKLSPPPCTHSTYAQSVE